MAPDGYIQEIIIIGGSAPSLAIVYSGAVHYRDLNPVGMENRTSYFIRALALHTI
jgi:hypothetical protein